MAATPPPPFPSPSAPHPLGIPSPPQPLPCVQGLTAQLAATRAILASWVPHAGGGDGGGGGSSSSGVDGAGREREASGPAEEDEAARAARQIAADIPRTAPSLPLYHIPDVAAAMARILGVYAARHPACGYVQGMNDVLTPYLALFLADAAGAGGDVARVVGLTTLDGVVSAAGLARAEADAYGALAATLAPVADHFVFAQPGIQRRSHYLAALLERVDPPLAAHLGTTHGVPFLSFTVRWFGCLLVREFRSLPALLRLWDGLVAEEGGWAHLAVYVVAALLVERRAALLGAADFGAVVRELLTPVGGGGGDLGGVLGRAWVWRESFRGLHQRALGG